MWHVEWHLDVLALWALASTKETSKAEGLLKSIKSRCKLSHIFSYLQENSRSCYYTKFLS